MIGIILITKCRCSQYKLIWPSDINEAGQYFVPLSSDSLSDRIKQINEGKQLPPMTENHICRMFQRTGIVDGNHLLREVGIVDMNDAPFVSPEAWTLV